MDGELDRILASWQAGMVHRTRLLGGEVVDHGGFVTLLSGLPVPWLNPTRVVREPEDPAAALAAAEAAHPAHLAFGADVVVDRFPRARAALAAAGLTRIVVDPVMAAARDDLVAAPPPAGVRIVRAEDRVAEVAEVDASIFGDPPEVSRDYLAPFGLSDPALAVYAAVEGDRILGGVEATTDAGVVRVTGVGVIPEARRRGIGAALTAAAVLGGDADLAFLEADGGSEDVYARIGFRRVATWEIWSRAEPRPA